MIHFRLTLTDNKPFIFYLKKMVILSVLLFILLMSLNFFIFGIHPNGIFGVVILSIFGGTRFYLNKVYFIEPFFMLDDSVISYRIHSFNRISVIMTNRISKILIKDSLITFIVTDNKMLKMRLKWIPIKYSNMIFFHLNKFAKEKNIQIIK